MADSALMAGVVISLVNSEVQAGHGISLSKAGRKFPGFRDNQCVNGSTVWRWAQLGARDVHGNRVKLEVCRVGGRWLTSEQAIARFVARLSGSQTDPEQDPAPRSPTARRRASDAAVAELERMGA